MTNRKLAYVPRPNRAPSKRRPQIETLLLRGLTFKQIALALSKGPALSLSKGTVLWHAQQIYKQHGVHSLPDLLAKHGQEIPPAPHKEIRRRILEGQSIAQIAVELGVDKMMIYNQRQQLRKQRVHLPDARGSNGKPATTQASAGIAAS